MNATAQISERIEAIRGRLLMVDFNADAEDWYRCQVRLSDNSAVICTFDHALADTVEHALRHEVHIIGVATVDASIGHILALHIGELRIVDAGAIREADLDAALTRFREENDTVAHLREALRHVLRDETYPISDLWRMVDNDTLLRRFGTP